MSPGACSINDLRYAQIQAAAMFQHVRKKYLTIIPRARMGSESIAHEAEGRIGYCFRGHEGERNNYFSKIRLVSKKFRDKTALAS